MKHKRQSMWVYKLLVAVLIISTVLAIWLFWHSRGRVPALALGGKKMTQVLKDEYNYQQRDPRWAEQRLGQRAHTGTLGSHGCTVSAIANALSNLDILITPGELNQQMSAHGGFNERGWLVWGALETITEGKAYARVFNQPSLAALDRCLENGEYPIVKYLIGGVVQHWATITGKQGYSYLIRDPLINQPAAITLTSRTPIILSLRCIGAVQAD